MTKKAVLAGILLAILGRGPAAAHGDMTSSIPPPGSALGKPPDHVIVNFGEPPTAASVVEVVDGCNRDVVDHLSFQAKAAHVFLTRGQPGRWRVSYDVISDVDGHRTSGRYFLRVRGAADCSQPQGEGKDGGRPLAKDDGAPPEGDGSGLPLVPVALGSAALIAGAFVVRRLTA